MEGDILKACKQERKKSFCWYIFSHTLLDHSQHQLFHVCRSLQVSSWWLNYSSSSHFTLKEILVAFSIPKSSLPFSSSHSQVVKMWGEWLVLRRAELSPKKRWYKQISTFHCGTTTCKPPLIRKKILKGKKLALFYLQLTPVFTCPLFTS